MDEEVEALFRHRVPEAAARQLATVLAWATECELATLETLQARKGTSKADLARHAEIVRQLVYHCRDLGVRPSGLGGSSCPRLVSALAETVAS